MVLAFAFLYRFFFGLLPEDLSNRFKQEAAAAAVVVVERRQGLDRARVAFLELFQLIGLLARYRILDPLKEIVTVSKSAFVSTAVNMVSYLSWKRRSADGSRSIQVIRESRSGIPISGNAPVPTGSGWGMGPIQAVSGLLILITIVGFTAIQLTVFLGTLSRLAEPLDFGLDGENAQTKDQNNVQVKIDSLQAQLQALLVKQSASPPGNIPEPSMAREDTNVETLIRLNSVESELDELETGLEGIIKQLVITQIALDARGAELSLGSPTIVPWSGGTYSLTTKAGREVKVQFPARWIPSPGEWPRGIAGVPSVPVFVKELTAQSIPWIPAGYERENVLGFELSWPPMPSPTTTARPHPKVVIPYPESTEGRPWGQPLKKPAGAPLNLG